MSFGMWVLSEWYINHSMWKCSHLTWMCKNWTYGEKRVKTVPYFSQCGVAFKGVVTSLTMIFCLMSLTVIELHKSVRSLWSYGLEYRGTILWRWPFLHNTVYRIFFSFACGILCHKFFVFICWSRMTDWWICERGCATIQVCHVMCVCLSTDYIKYMHGLLLECLGTNKNE